MARGDLSVVINSETKAFKQGVDTGIIKPLEDAEKALEDLGRTRTGDQIERDMRAAQRATENLTRETKDAASVIEREFRDAYRKASKSADGFQRDASGNVQNFKQEAVQNFSEVASSFDGSIQDMASGVQGLSGGLAASLTPGIGIPIAILGAVAAAFTASWAQAAEDSEQRVSDMYDDFIESGRTFVSEDFIGKSIQDIQTDTNKWADAQKRVQDSGEEISTVLRAMAGDQAAIAEVHAGYVRQRDEELGKVRDTVGGIEVQQRAVEQVNQRFEESVSWIGQIQTDTGTAADKAAAYRDAMGGAVDNAAKVRDIVGQIQDRSITIGVNVNNAGFENWWRTVQNRAAQGITVNMRPDQGRAWE